MEHTNKYNMKIKTKKYKSKQLSTLEKILTEYPNEKWNYCRLLDNSTLSVSFILKSYNIFEPYDDGLDYTSRVDRLCLTCVTNLCSQDYKQYRKYEKLCNMTESEAKTHKEFYKKKLQMFSEMKYYEISSESDIESNSNIGSNSDSDSDINSDIYSDKSDDSIKLRYKQKISFDTLIQQIYSDKKIPIEKYVYEKKILKLMAQILMMNNSNHQINNPLEYIDEKKNIKYTLNQWLTSHLSYTKYIDVVLYVYDNHKDLICCSVSENCTKSNCPIIKNTKNIFKSLETNRELKWSQYLAYECYFRENYMTEIRDIDITYILNNPFKNWDYNKLSHNAEFKPQDFEILLTHCSNYPHQVSSSNLMSESYHKSGWKMAGLSKYKNLTINHILNYPNLISYWDYKIISSNSSIHIDDILNNQKFDWDYRNLSDTILENLTYEHIIKNLHLNFDYNHIFNLYETKLTISDVCNLLQLNIFQNKSIDISNRKDLTVEFVRQCKKYINFDVLSSNCFQEKYKKNITDYIFQSHFIIQDLADVICQYVY